MEPQPGLYEPTGRCLTCDSRTCTDVCMNPPTDTDDTPDDLTYLED